VMASGVVIENAVESLPSPSKKTVEPPPLRTIWPHLELGDHPIDEIRPLRVIVVGAGMSGITAGVLLPAKVPGIDLAIYESQSGVVSRSYVHSSIWDTRYHPIRSV
jgi:hypothetical protein